MRFGPESQGKPGARQPRIVPIKSMTTSLEIRRGKILGIKNVSLVKNHRLINCTEGTGNGFSCHGDKGVEKDRVRLLKQIIEQMNDCEEYAMTMQNRKCWACTCLSL